MYSARSAAERKLYHSNADSKPSCTIREQSNLESPVTLYQNELVVTKVMSASANNCLALIDVCVMTLLRFPMLTVRGYC